MDALSKRIVIVGVGPGSADFVTEAARRAVATASVLTGAQRLLELFAESSAVKLPFAGSVEPWLEQVAELAERTSGASIAVLVSGDPGVSSLAARVLRRFGQVRCRVVAGISSVQLTCAALGLDWQNAAIISAHGSLPEPPSDDMQTRDPWIFLMGARGAEAYTAKLVTETGRTGYRCEDLSLPSECVMRTSAEELAGLSPHPRRIVVLTHELRDEL